MKVRNVAAGMLALALALPVSAKLFPPGIQDPPIPEYYPFTQSGYSTGNMYGWFWGTDKNGDGSLTTSELSTFQFSFLANGGSSFQTLAVPVDQIFANGGGFNFKLGGSVLGDDAGEFVAAATGATNSVGTTVASSYMSGPNGGTFTTTDPLWPLPQDTTRELVQVLPAVLIPEPATYALMVAGMLLIGVSAGMNRRRGAGAVQTRSRTP